MHRLLFVLVALITLISCSKNNDDNDNPPIEIPDIITGFATEFSVIPQDLTTPKTGVLLVAMNNTFYKVEFAAVPQSQHNAEIVFLSDSILTADSREFANFGQDIVAYTPVHENELELIFTDGRKVTAIFDNNTFFAGTFGQTTISLWRDGTDPLKPNQKAKDDIAELMRRYSDADGAGPETTPTYLSVKVSIL